MSSERALSCVRKFIDSKGETDGFGHTRAG